MAYNAVEQIDHDDHSDSDHDSGPVLASAYPSNSLASPVFAPPLSASLGLFLDDPQNTSSSSHSQNISSTTGTTTSTKTSASYEMVEGDDFADDARSSPLFASYEKGDSNSGGLGQNTHTAPPSAASPSEEGGASPPVVPLHVPQPRRRLSPATGTIPDTIARKTSVRKGALQHPTPDLQVLQGAYTGNIEHLERTAERLSMTSSIQDAIKYLHDEQKRSDSRKSSLLSNQGMAAITRQVSNHSSIIEVNSAARSGGYSPAGFMMSPGGSFTTGGVKRSASKSSRYGSRPEPEMEGRPLDSFVNLPSIPTNSPMMSISASINEQDEGSATLTRPVVDLLARYNGARERSTTSASTNTYEQGEKMFADFDGVHSYEVDPSEHPETPEHQQRRASGHDLNSPENAQQRVSGYELDNPDNVQRRLSSGTELDTAHRSVSFANELDIAQRRLSAGNRLTAASMARPQSYADPDSGQQMVYYPAPVPMMLNLPQKLSKAPSSMARNKRRSQVMSNIPPAARQSAIWLPDVLEDEQDITEDVGIHDMEYVPQHQRMTMGGRRSTQDLSKLPPQLRASTFFDLPGPEQKVEMKEHSAVATLDSILDASAHAPVSAFTDHAYAGHLGAEVYGQSELKRNSRSSTQLLQPTSIPKKRTSSFNLLLGRRASSNDLLETNKLKKRASTMSGGLDEAGAVTRDEDESKDTTPMTDSENDPHSRVTSGNVGLKGEDPEESSEDEGQRDDEEYHGAPTTLLAELQLRKQQQKKRIKPLASAYPNGMHSTLLQLDAVAQVEQRSRKQKRVNLAWEDPSVQEPMDEADDEDVPLAMLYSKKDAEINRPIGLMERRDMEDNEPLSRRRDRLQGRPPGAGRASTMMNLPTSPAEPEEEGETLAQRIRRLKEGGTTNNLPAARPVSGDFASEMLSQFGDLNVEPAGKGKEKEIVVPEDETLGQRRKRLQAERDARAKEVGPLNKRRSMADILQAHPSAGAGLRTTSYEKPVGGLLGMHEKAQGQRASTMLNLEASHAFPSRAPAGGHKTGFINPGHGGGIPQQQIYNPNAYGKQFPQPSLGFNHPQQNMMPFANPYAAMGYNPNAMAMNMNMNMAWNPMIGAAPLNQGQIDMVERWRQSIMQ
ncbi:hypothetical protein LSUB1_G003636 [Lachnellula subtilissima]|uniref:Uncharacterized protein n=1 Tax=Lachnellula subtilissima TaxID=602034 RepID=A0A8H8UC90_9HELO|nr:hypothetical protein LSUB1_G003636 [Lachnellula subtilissima]